MRSLVNLIYVCFAFSCAAILAVVVLGAKGCGYATVARLEQVTGPMKEDIKKIDSRVDGLSAKVLNNSQDIDKIWKEFEIVDGRTKLVESTVKNAVLIADAAERKADKAQEGVTKLTNAVCEAEGRLQAQIDVEVAAREKANRLVEELKKAQEQSSDSISGLLRRAEAADLAVTAEKEARMALERNVTNLNTAATAATGQANLATSIANEARRSAEESAKIVTQTGYYQYNGETWFYYDKNQRCYRRVNDQWILEGSLQVRPVSEMRKPPSCGRCGN